MSKNVTHADLVKAFEHAIRKSREAGIHVVENLVDWRTNYGSSTNRIKTLYGTMLHHTGGVGKYPAYALGLATGSIRPDIGRGLCNTSTPPSHLVPEAQGRPVIIINGCDYMNHAGAGDVDFVLNELKDRDVDTDRMKPGRDDGYLNRYLWGNESWGLAPDPGQLRAQMVFYAHAMDYLGLTDDVDNDGKTMPVILHSDATTRKVDMTLPAGYTPSRIREEMQAILGKTTVEPIEVPAPEPAENAPKPTVGSYVNPFVAVKVDGLWGAKTTSALQHCLKHKYNAWGIGKPLVVDGIVGKNTYRALQRVLNQQMKISLQEDGIFGPATKRALQRYLNVRVDGIVGRATVRALQTRLNRHTF